MPKITSANNRVHSRLLLGRARFLLVKARQKELAPYHVTPQQANVLTIIEDLGNKANFAELAERTERKLNTLSMQMTRMENDGLIKKVRQTPKSNQLAFELTEKGKNICREAKKIKSIKTIMSALNEEEHRQFALLLGKIIAKAEKY
jgi:DNA-binding MarR family transcriptional regulator